MDAKITKLRLSRMLSYDWVKIVAIAAAGIFVWVLVFTMTATRIIPSQQFSVFNYVGNVSFSYTNFYDDFEKTMNGNVLSYEVIESTVNDLAANEDYAGTLMEARLSTNEGDVIFVADIIDESSKTTVTDENGETTVEYETYLEGLVGSWWHKLTNLDLESEKGFFKKMEAYVNGFYDEPQDYKAATEAKDPDAEKVERAFRARAKKNKDKRYKTEKQIKKGVENDCIRIKKYYGALVEFYDYLESGYIEMTTVVLDEHNSGVFSINLCPNEETMGELKNIAAYNLYYYVDENGQEVPASDASDAENSGIVYEELSKTTAKDMNIAFFNLEVEEGFQYESLLYVNHLVKTYCTELKN